MLLTSVAFNYGVGRALITPGRSPSSRKRWYRLVVAANLSGIAYFKYAGFMGEIWNQLVSGSVDFRGIVLPLAISFFTFQQIAYLIDVYKDPALGERDPVRYLLFVIFFPQLIAGPIVHHHSLIPQLGGKGNLNLRSDNLALGFTVFATGLFKKSVIADTFATQATPIFDDAAAGTTPDFLTAWLATLAYALQLYFDFSGYSDMAIGLGRMFGVTLPLNFNSPYKAHNIADFWRRWHMTLSVFLRDYLYVPLGGNRRGPTRRYVNLMLTMMLGGLWHGAGWTYLLWGTLHGAYLVVHRVIANVRERIPLRKSRVEHGLAVLVTYLAVVLAWVPFRAQNMEAAGRIFRGLTAAGPVVLPAQYFDRLQNLPGAGPLLHAFHVSAGELGTLIERLWVVVLMLVMGHLAVFFLPNVQQLFHAGEGSATSPVWHPTRRWALVAGVLFAVSLAALSGKTEFLYFQF